MRRDSFNKEQFLFLSANPLTLNIDKCRESYFRSFGASLSVNKSVSSRFHSAGLSRE